MPQVAHDAQQKERGAEKVFPFRNPGDGFHVQGMKAEQEARRSSGDQNRPIARQCLRPASGGGSPCDLHKPCCQEKHQESVGDVEKKVRQMMSERIQSPDGVIRGMGYPCEGMPIVGMEIEKSPTEKLSSMTAAITLS